MNSSKKTTNGNPWNWGDETDWRCPLWLVHGSTRFHSMDTDSNLTSQFKKSSESWIRCLAQRSTQKCLEELSLSPQRNINVGTPWREDHIPFTPHQDAPRRMTDLLSNVPKMELGAWVLTVRCFVSASLAASNQLGRAGPTAGNIKPGSTGPLFWSKLALAGQYGGFLIPQFVYWTTTAYNGFRQPEWMREYALPSPPDVFGVDGVVVGRVLGSLATHAGWAIASTAIEVLGDQYATIGVSALFFPPWVTGY